MGEKSREIGEFIQMLAEEQNLNPTDLGRKINKTLQNVKDIYKRTTIDSDLLLTLSKELNKNIFEYFNDKEPIASFKKEELESWGKKIDDLLGQITFLEIQNKAKDTRIEELLARISDQEKIINLLEEKKNS